MSDIDEAMRRAEVAARAVRVDTPWVNDNGDWRISPDTSQRMIRAALASLAASGWVLVPREATQKMANAAFMSRAAANLTWQCMLAAAPKPGGGA